MKKKFGLILAIMLSIVMTVSAFSAFAEEIDAETIDLTEDSYEEFKETVEKIIVIEETEADEANAPVIVEEIAESEEIIEQEEIIIEEIIEEIATDEAEPEADSEEAALLEEDETAEEDKGLRGCNVVVNPRYSTPELEAEAEERLEELQESLEDEDFEQMPSLDAYYSDASSAAAFIREKEKNRVTDFSFSMYYAGEDDTAEEVVNSYLNNLFTDVAMQHTGVSNEGDYIAWNWRRFDYTWNLENHILDVKKVTFQYYTTTEEEQLVNVTLPGVYSSLGLSSMSEYDKILTIYKYICDHVAYDYKGWDDYNYYNSLGKLSAEHCYIFTTYSALIKGTAVCQGYAVLFYRMALDNGLNVRVVGGNGGGAHVWNCVNFEGTWYFIDATWDEDLVAPTSYRYFMRGTEYFFKKHTIANLYMAWNIGISNLTFSEKDLHYFTVTDTLAETDSNQYKLEAVSYPLFNYYYYGGEKFNWKSSDESIATVNSEGLVTILKGGQAVITITTEDGNYVSKVTVECKHNYEKIDLPAVPATCTKTGLTAGKKCSFCNKVIVAQEETVADHKLTKTAAVAATTEKDGNTEYYTCSVCGKFFSDEKGEKEITKDSWIIKKLEKSSPESISLDKTSIEAGMNTKVQLKTTVLPAGADQAVTWSTSDSGLAKVDENGLVTIGLKRGTVTIKATTADGSLYAACTINIQFNDILSLSNGFKKAINWMADKGVAKGYDNGAFGQADTCTRKQFAIMLYRYAGKPSVNGAMKFNDCSYGKNSDSYKAIIWASQQGIVKGYDDGSFRPDNTVTRQQILIMLYRYAGKPSISGSMPFTDVKAGKNSDTYKAILWGSQKGITSGTSATTFSPNEGCLRRQIALFLYRYNGIK